LKKIYLYFTKTKIKRPKFGRRFVIGDIHGCAETLQNLIEVQLKLTTNDQLFLLGDMIQKGPQSRQTIDYIIDLIKQGYKIYPIRGNHEQEALNTSDEEPELLIWLFKNSQDMLDNDKLKKKYYNFFSALPYYYELDNFFLVHAGFNFKVKYPFEDFKSMMWIRKFETNEKFIGNKTIIHGHQPQDIFTIKDDIAKKKKVIGLDCGVNYRKKHKIYDYKKMAWLCALDMDSYELYIQKNIELY